MHRLESIPLLVLLALLSLAAWVPCAVRADDLTEFEAARSLYESRRYAEAVDAFRELVGSVPRLSDRLLILESRKYLAASLLFVGAKEEARNQFRLLLQQEPNYTLDPLAFPGEVLDLFGEVKAEIQTAQEQQRAQQETQAREAERLAAAIAARQRENMERLRSLAEVGERQVLHSRWIASIPFGVGQFQNGHKGLGVVLAMSEGLAAATSVATYLAHERLSDNQPAPDELSATRRLESLLYTTNIASFSAFAFLALVGVVDAHVRFVPGHLVPQQRPLPSDLERWLEEHALSPQGLRIRF